MGGRALGGEGFDLFFLFFPLLFLGEEGGGSFAYVGLCPAEFIDFSMRPM